MAGFTANYLGAKNREAFYRAYLSFLSGCGLPFWNVELTDVSDGMHEATEIVSIAPDGEKRKEQVKNGSAEDMAQTIMWLLVDEYEQWKTRQGNSARPELTPYPVYR